MQYDKSFIDKNSLQFQMLQKDIEEKQNIQSKLKENGGYIDPNMKNFEITDKKVINDLCNKFQFKKSNLVPVFKQNEDEEYLKNLNFQKLHEQVVKE